ncbi:MAG TPA: TolC family protein [Puia sp.]|nr:TolC family protein [Puia sp.]
MKRIILFIPMLALIGLANAQSTDTAEGYKTLEGCIAYALAHQTNIKQARIDQEIADRSIKSHLADWFPQVNFDGNYQYNFQLPATIFNGVASPIGTKNASYGYFGLSQTIFNRDVLFTQQTAADVRNLAKQNTVATTIDVVANVSKAFYDVLLSKAQVILLDSDIVLLQRSLKDAYNQYTGGLVDKTDYQRATITLNNSIAALKISEEAMKSKTAVLKLLMSYPADSALELEYDSAKMAEHMLDVDTLQQVDFNNRIEYQSLTTTKRLQQANLKYYKWGFLPSVTAFGEYNLNYYNNEFSKLYSNNFPNSYAGLSLSIPIFQGTKRIQQVRIAELQLKRLDYNFVSLADTIKSQYVQALASYKANLKNYFEQRENLALAREVYDIIRLQYRAGVKTYLDVITANNDLFSSQVNLINAIFQVLVNKIDVERALGTLKY